MTQQTERSPGAAGGGQPAPFPGGVFRSGDAPARLTIGTPLAENQQITITARMERGGWLRLYTGRGREHIGFGLTLDEAPLLHTVYTDPIGTQRQRTLHPAGGAAELRLTDLLLDWQAHYDALAAAHSIRQRRVRLTLQLRGKLCRFLLDGRLLHEWIPTEDLYGARPVGNSIRVRGATPEITSRRPPTAARAH